MADAPRVNFTTGMQNSQSVQPKIATNPSMVDKAVVKTEAKHTLFCSHDVMNLHLQDGTVVSFRGHVFRTDEDKVKEEIIKNYCGRRDVAFEIKCVTEEELQELLVAPAGPAHEVTIEPIPDQGQNDPNPDFVNAKESSSDGKESTQEG